MVNEGNSDMVTVTSAVFPNPKDIFTASGTTEDSNKPQSEATLTFSSNAKIGEFKLTVTNAAKVTVEIFREDGSKADSKVRNCNIG
jgi:hypothetical protein